MLKNKTAVITGGARGIGKAIALALAAEEANIAIIYASNNVAAAEVCTEASSNGIIAKAYACNVADANEVKATMAKILEDFGGVDILVNNAGITKDGLLGTMSEANFSEVIAVNLTGAFHLVKSLYGHFLKKRAGRIINISSISGLMGNAGQSNYAAAKAGLIGFTKSIAKELAGRGITCNAIAPGFIATEMTDQLAADKQAKIKAQIPLQRFGTANDIAQMAVFLASDKASYITGEVIKIDGGLYI